VAPCNSALGSVECSFSAVRRSQHDTACGVGSRTVSKPGRLVAAIALAACVVVLLLAYPDRASVAPSGLMPQRVDPQPVDSASANSLDGDRTPTQRRSAIPDSGTCRLTVVGNWEDGSRASGVYVLCDYYPGRGTLGEALVGQLNEEGECSWTFDEAGGAVVYSAFCQSVTARLCPPIDARVDLLLHRGEGQIGGMVTDREGCPVPRATVIMGVARGTVEIGRSGEDGRFAVSLTLDTEICIGVDKEGYSASRRVWISPTDSGRHDIDFVLDSGFQGSLRIVDRSGQGVAQARVVIGGRRHLRAKVPDNPRLISLPVVPASYSDSDGWVSVAHVQRRGLPVWVLAKGYAQAAQTVDFTVKADVVLTLEREARLRGVVTVGGYPAEGVRVYHEKPDSPGRLVSISGHAGQYEMIGLPVGRTVEVRAGAKDLGIAMTVVELVAGCNTVWNPALMTQEDAGGTVLDKVGQPVQGAHVLISVGSTAGARHEYVTTDRYGRFCLKERPINGYQVAITISDDKGHDRLPRLSCRQAGIWQNRNWMIDTGLRSTLDWTLDKGLDGIAGNWFIQLSHEESRELVAPTAGHLLIPNLAPGAYRLWYDGPEGTVGRWCSDDLEVKAGAKLSLGSAEWNPVSGLVMNGKPGLRWRRVK